MKEDILNGAGAAYDTLKEVGALIEENKDAIEALETIVGIQADWAQSDVNAKDFIKNKPTNLATKEDLNKAIEEINLSGYATETFVEEKIAEAELGGGEVDLSGYAQKSELPTKVSQLENDSNYLTAVPEGYVKSLSDLGITATATELNYVDGVTSDIQTQLNKKTNDFSIEIYNGTSGNPKPVKFTTVSYSTCNSENGVLIKIGMVSGHGNGSSYAFLQDAFIKVNYNGGVEVDNFKYYGASVTDSGVERQYGDIFWVIDTTNKIVDFYCLMGQYARLVMIPYKKLTYSTGGTVTQYTSCTVYSSGDKIWANNSNIALVRDIDTVISELDGKMSKSDPTGTGSLSINRKSDTTIGENSVAIGLDTTSSGQGSYAEGIGTKSTSSASHAEGFYTEASGSHAHAEGHSTIASGVYSHAEGDQTTASGFSSHAEGWGTIAASEYQHVQGKYNVADTAARYAHIVGGGNSDTSPANIHTISWGGDAWFKKDVYVGGSSKDNATRLARMSDLNRTGAVNVADTNYTTLMARGTSLNSVETNPAVNGAIAWTYE